MPPSWSWQSQVDYIMERGSIDSVMIISSEDGALWASSHAHDSSKPDTGYYLREYKTVITQDDGSEVEELVNEAKNILTFMKGSTSPHGIRINGTKKQQITRKSNGVETGLPVVLTRFPMGGSLIINAGKCILIGCFDEKKGHSPPDFTDTLTLMGDYFFKSTWPTQQQFDAMSGGPSSSASVTGEGGGKATWEQYIEKMLLARGNISDAVIISLKDGGKILASTPTVELKTYEAELAQDDGTDKVETVNELKNLIAFATTGSKGAQGLRINARKYQVVRTNEEDPASGCRFSTAKVAMGGVAIGAVAGAYVLVGLYDERQGHSAVESMAVLSALAKHLKDSVAS